MPEFILNTSGSVVDSRPQAQPKLLWKHLDAVEQGYIEAFFFTEESPGLSTEEWRAGCEPGTNDGALPGDVGFSDLAPSALETIRADCAAFQQTPAFLAFAAWRDDDDSPDTSPADDSQVGHDLWLTRNGHGAGFWDRPESYYGPHRDALDAAAKAFGETWATFGDDGLVYLD